MIFLMLLIILIIIAGFLTWQSVQETSEIQKVASLCEQTANGAHVKMLNASQDWADYQYDQESLVACRCLALLETQQSNEAVLSLDRNITANMGFFNVNSVIIR